MAILPSSFFSAISKSSTTFSGVISLEKNTLDFILRSFLSRIKEVGVLRAIGLKKRDIYKMFLGEIIVLTTLTALPGMLLMAYMISEIIKIPYAGDSLMINPGIVILSFGVVFLFNILAGLMPVVGTVRKAPAAILARNDVN